MKWALALLIPLCLAAPAPAQEAADSAAAPGVLVVETNLPDGELSANGERLGRAGEGRFELAPGSYALVLDEPNREAWRPRRAEASVEIGAGETVALRLDVPTRYRVESFPYGATVALDGADGEEVLGETPLVAEFDAPLEGELVVRLPGHHEARQPAGAAADNAYTVVLRPFDPSDENAVHVGLEDRREPNVWIDVAAGALALGAGALAVHFKQQGDALYDEYEATGDPALRSDIRRYDTYSAVALGAMQVGLGVLAVRLVLR